MYKIVFLKNERNDATDYYVQLIKKSLESNGGEVCIVQSIKDINKDDKVLTISLKAFVYTWLKNPKQFIFHWFQGVSPEEAMLIYSSKISKYFRWIYLSYFEKFVLNKSKFNFFVSESMRKHYEKKYNYNKLNFIAMPCYNQAINKEAFSDEKYKIASFVYAGSLSKWQCINETLQIFKQIEEKNSSAVMYLYTNEKNEAFKLIDKYKIKNIYVDYVPYEQLNDHLKKIKYGFLLREDNIINRVSTPTKMNGYLANGIVPILSNVIDDFNENLVGDYLITSDKSNELIDKILGFEKKEISAKAVYNEYQSFFEKYYSDSHYLVELSQKLKEFKVV
ncbi:glycosyltransferase family protein [Acinetobacter junii]|uniref:hypothetical protein n=1 Tax=Acinetobacter junii TaxID=40215 RepID=UPI0021CD2CA0|nr:hypothetical protein [Acinetobacter junii]MCU4406437.1 hypothetical protein [Acinetobacter junii]